MICRNCGTELVSPAAFCLVCNTRNALGCGLFCDGSNIYLFFIAARGHESFKIALYEDEFEISRRNAFELAAERMHEKRVEDVFVSGTDRKAILDAAEWVRRTAIHPVSVITTDTFNSPEEFCDAISRHLRAKTVLRRIDARPEDKIGGAHSTIIGGREGAKLLHRIATCEYVKKIVPGVIEAKGTAAGGGVRLKLNRSDERGNIRAILIDGASVQKVLVITTASNAEEGEEVRKILEGYLRS
ncbi:DUF2103 domain-containing protein [Archaeoglobus veneficus]|uniref:Metal-binding protein n=1 Tax=Archaeoglobus veneficus (strain DSM 11195 / SNP6) TaxID=693661 RepID=F2KNM9_ARCVS|nr:DUF2103 domain-containing protein [Archaeoglobus veneficus]AEA46257.1 Protein of unknown function DUF2103, metal-binding protein [Archaeoglobus veneficus SNP6]